MTTRPRPRPDGENRASKASGQRLSAAILRQPYEPARHDNNGELDAYGPAAPASFTKGLPHDAYGLTDPEALDRFVRFLDQGDAGFAFPDPGGEEIAMGPEGVTNSIHPPGYDVPDDMMKGYVSSTGKNAMLRAWESPLAGHAYDLEGADAGAISMPPAPVLGSGELSAEMGEVYALALLRDVPFETIATGGAAPDPAPGVTADAEAIVGALARMPWFSSEDDDPRAEERRKARLDSDDALTPRIAFRGSTRGAQVGPYLSQFMLVGNAGRENNGDGKVSATDASDAPGAYNIRAMLPVNVGYTELASIAPSDMKAMAEEKTRGPRKAKEGFILYGTQEISQKVVAHRRHDDYMTDWAHWIDVQNGANLKDNDVYEQGGRFIATPRDLASYVHFDALYQAYLNACLIMLGYKVPFDRGLPEGTKRDGRLRGPRDAFATFGGPHVLSLVTEVASRALKLARRQKFNIHLRARPEAVAGLLTLAAHKKHATRLTPEARKALGRMHEDFAATRDEEGVGLLEMIEARNVHINTEKSLTPPDGDWIGEGANHLLPMAFPEGSPMHPSYAAGHATVAGACVTVLKAFFDLYKEDAPVHDVQSTWQETPFADLYGDTPDKRTDALGEAFTSGLFVPSENAHILAQLPGAEPTVTILGELDKLAANISIGRDMAGVHYYTDYYESLRMGERLAVSILQEQMLTYREAVTMSLTTFDGEQMRITGDGQGTQSGVRVEIAKGGAPILFRDWFQRGADSLDLATG